MKNRFFALIALVIAASMTFAACDAASFEGFEEAVGIYADNGFDMDELLELPAIDIVTVASEIIEETGSYLVEMMMFMEMHMMGLTIDMEMFTVAAYAFIDGENLEFASESLVTASMLGMIIEEEFTALYYRDGVMYTYELGEMTIMEFDMESMIDNINSMTPALMEDYTLTGFELTEDGVLMEFAISDDLIDNSLDLLMNTGFGDIMGMDAEVLEVLDDLELSFSNMSMTVLIGFDGYISIMITEMSMFMVVEGLETEMDILVIMEYTQIGGVEVEFPDNLEDYK
ncbi:MAG: hypothetical protein FWE91_03795 [Defluviitaleaceae bacterium]|nr:hypothetical protein [Defluviitaleaceae bacterium]MCL2835974.1 hypothetical protein [Defluviitaleaceae bacterium]